MRTKARCAKRVPSAPTPLGWSLEALTTSAKHRHLLEPGARCEREAGHAGTHKAGSVVWHDPAAVFVGDRRVG